MIFVTAVPFLGRSVAFEGRANGMHNFACFHRFQFLCLLENIHLLSSFLQIRDECTNSGTKCRLS